MLRNFDGEKSRLGNAEKFLLKLLEVPRYEKELILILFYILIFFYFLFSNLNYQGENIISLKHFLKIYMCNVV